MFANKINLAICQKVSIFLIEIIEACACFEEIIKNTKISIDDIVIYISIFVVICFDYKILLKQFFQQIARISFVNINNSLFELSIYFANRLKCIKI